MTMALVLLAPRCDAQTAHTIAWSKIAGGGATTPSTAGVYAVRGTVGQHDAGVTLAVGVYSFTGGFWPGVDLAPLADASPLLASELLSNGSVRFYWPLPATDFLLEQTTALVSPTDFISWKKVASRYQTNATHISITISPDLSSTFYRLRRP